MKKIVERLRSGFLALLLKLTKATLEKELEPFRGRRVPYGELVGAPWPYCCQGELTYGDPDLDMMQTIHDDVSNYLEYLDDCRKPTRGCPFEGDNDEDF